MDSNSDIQDVRHRVRRILSCIPCRKHKLKCDREIPCEACCRLGRGDKCLQYPFPNKASSLRRMDNSGGSKSTSNVSPVSEKAVPAIVSMEAEAPSSKVISTMAILPLPPTFEVPELTMFRQMHIGDVVNARRLQVSSLNSQRDYWSTLLCAMLPERAACDVLIHFFFQNLNWIYRSVHSLSFMKSYEVFWTQKIEDADVHWLALLFSLLCASGVRVTAHHCLAHGLDFMQIQQSTHLWYSASRQALTIGDWECTPSIEALQAIVNLQHYLYATRKDEAINILLASSVRSAHVLGLDHENRSADLLQRDMYHRVWWAICDSDTFHAISTELPPFVQSYLSTVPLPLNCNDVDITPTAVNIHLADKPTEMSMNIAKSKIFRALNRLFKDDCAHLNSYDFVASVDAELTEIYRTFPWFFKLEFSHSWPTFSPTFDFIPWSYQLLHGCLCMQRIRMYRPFLSADTGIASEIVLTAASDALAVYQVIRDMRPSPGNGPRNSGIIYYQLFSMAVTLAVLLIVERPAVDERVISIRKGIEAVATDLEQLKDSEIIPVAAEQNRIIGQLLAMYDASEKTQFHHLGLFASSLRTILGRQMTKTDHAKQVEGRLGANFPISNCG